jgi:hypothetical protein
MTEIKELDVVSLARSASAQVVGESRSVQVPENTKGTVVLVHKENGKVVAFEVEFFLSEREYALATVPINQVSLVL